MFDCYSDKITDFIKIYKYSTIYLTDTNNVQSQNRYMIYAFMFV
jgi:hypothetical protein